MPAKTRSRVGAIAGFALFVAGAQGCADAAEVPTIDALPLWSATEGGRTGSLDDPELSFGAVTDVTIGPDGRVYSLHTREPAIRRWTMEGSPAGRLGRRGSGPGEFEMPVTMAWRADSLWVLDPDGDRMSFFDTAGVHLSQIAVRADAFNAPPNGGSGHPMQPIGYLSDGSVLFQTAAFSHEIVEGRLRELSFTRTARDGRTLDTLATVPVGTETVLGVMMEGGVGTYADQPYADGVIGLPTAAYDGLLILERKVSATRDAAGFRLSRISLTGDTTFSRTFAYRPAPVDRAEVDSLVASAARTLHRFVGNRTGTTLDQWTGWVDKAMYKPEFHPPINTMVPGRDGTIWLSRNPVIDGQREWLVLSAEGDPLGRIRLPAGFRLMEASGNRVWGADTDDLGVEYIVSYELAKE